MNKNKVSIITPVYNAERFLKETIGSVKRQTYKNWELLLIDDCSTDSSSEIIKLESENDDRIKYIKLDKNKGAAVTRNIGLENATGRFIAFLDSDDIWDEKKLEFQIRFMLKNDVGFTFTSYRYTLEDGIPLPKVARAPKKIDYNGLLKNTIIGCSTVLIDKNKVGDFRMPHLRRGQDTATWLKLLKKEKYAYGLYEDLVKYRLVGNSISSNKIKALKRTWHTYRKVEKLNVFKASYVFCFYVFNAIRKRVINDKENI